MKALFFCALFVSPAIFASEESKIAIFSGVGIFEMAAPAESATNEVKGLQKVYPNGFKSGWGIGAYIDFPFATEVWGFKALGIGFGRAEEYATINSTADVNQTPLNVDDDLLITTGKRAQNSLAVFLHTAGVMTFGAGFEEGKMQFVVSEPGADRTITKNYKFPYLHFSLSSLNLTGGSGLFISLSASITSSEYMKGTTGFQGNTYAALFGWAFTN